MLHSWGALKWCIRWAHNVITPNILSYWEEEEVKTKIKASFITIGKMRQINLECTRKVCLLVRKDET